MILKNKEDHFCRQNARQRICWIKEIPELDGDVEFQILLNKQVEMIKLRRICDICYECQMKPWLRGTGVELHVFNCTV